MIPHKALLNVILKIKKMTVFFMSSRKKGSLMPYLATKHLPPPMGQREQLCILLLLPHPQQYFLLEFVIVGLVYVCAMYFDQSRGREKKREGRVVVGHEVY